MRYTWRYIIPTVLSILATPSCQTADEPLSVGITVTATPSGELIPVGDTLLIETVVRNSSVADVLVPGKILAAVEVRDASGRQLSFGRFGVFSLDAPEARVLAPGKSILDQIGWSGELTASTGGSSRAASGVYDIRAAVPVRSSEGPRWVYSDWFRVELVDR